MRVNLVASYAIILMMFGSCSADNKSYDQPVAEQYPPQQAPQDPPEVYPDTSVGDTVISTRKPNYEAPTEPVVESIEQPIKPAVDNTEIVQFRVQNTFNKSDKTYSCFIALDETNRIMVLRSLNNVDSYTLTRGEGSMFTLNYFSNQQLQATKTVYRRVDLEDQSTNQIYTSRTGEITLTLSYP